MKIITWIISLSTIFIFNFLNASNHHFDAGINVLQYRISDYVDGVKVEGDQCFLGVRFQYEYKPTNGVYFGLNTSGTIIENDKSFRFDIPNPYTTVLLANDLSFYGTDFRVGYTFDQCYYSICPFITLGRYKFDTNEHTSLKYCAKDYYLGAGFIINYVFNDYLDIGLIAKSLVIDHKANISYKGDHFSKNSTGCGLEASLPLTLHLYKQMLNFKVEPYFLTLSTRHKNFAYGSSFLLELAL